MEVLRWKGNHEIFCHSPPFGCSSVTSMSLSGGRGEETACQSMPFYDVQYGDLRQLFCVIVTLERGVLIYSAVFGPLEPPKPIKLKPFLSQNAIEIRAMYGTYPHHFPNAGCSPPPSTPAATLRPLRNPSQSPLIPPPDGLGSCKLLHQITVHVGSDFWGRSHSWDIPFQLNLY